MDGRQRLKLSLTNRSIGLISTPQTAPCAAASLLDARTAVRYILALTCTEPAICFGKSVGLEPW